MSKDLRNQIEEALQAFTEKDLRTASIDLLNTLGYRSDKTLDIGNSPEAFLEEFDKRDRPFRKDKAQFDNWKSIDFLFQITDDEVHDADGQGTFAFDSDYILGNYQSYLFFALDLRKDHYTRTQLADITRELNLLFNMPVMLLIQHSGVLTFSIIDRRLSKRDQSRDVLEKVKLIKDINYKHPHRAHIEILNDLSLTALISKYDCRSFKQLHEAWRETLDTDKLNKKFYRELASWYFWALDHVEFPADVEEDKATRNATNVIRLLTRLIFCWFLKEKTLIPDSLFNRHKLKDVLKSLNDDESSFYLAILQNLFFGTLNQRMNIDGVENRKFTGDGSFNQRKREYGVKNLYRYQKLFAISEKESVDLFAEIPFLNGGLFDCLDKEDKSGKVIYVDGFTRNPKKRPEVPNFLFFSDYRTVDLSDAYGDKRRKREKVRGLIRLLDSYKFTVTENTPIEEEIALDPELLGKVFENLLASYNPETGTTARKQTGSFYTPREIVNYMVDESLIAYLETRLEKSSKLSDMNNLQDQLRNIFAYTEAPHPFSEEVVETIIDAIDSSKILDPACGSGAFPMGILHKLVFILGKLDPDNKLWKEKQISKAEQIPDVSAREIAVSAIEKDFETNDLDYGRKLYLIENCIYGVDIQPIAIQISKLRFFISLICNQRANKNKAQNRGIRPLPNLETKFIAANTLIPIDREPYQGLLTDPRLPKLEQKMAAVRHKHFAAQRRRDKLNLQDQDSKIREEIASILEESNLSSETSKMLAAWDPYDQNASAPFFDPEWMYGITDGFDVVIGNPPYIRIQQIEHSEIDRYKKQWSTAWRRLDISILFFECTCTKLLTEDGHGCFISSNQFLTGEYGRKLRHMFLTKASIHTVVDFADLPVFPGQTTYVSVFLFSNRRHDIIKFSSVSELPFQRNNLHWYQVNPEYLTDESWDLDSPLAISIRMKVQTCTDSVLTDAALCPYGIITGKDPILMFERQQVDEGIIPIDRDLLLPVVRAQDINRYSQTDFSKYVFYPYRLQGKQTQLLSLDIIAAQFPTTFAYLDANENSLRARRDSRSDFGESDRWFGLTRFGQLTLFRQPKILCPGETKHNRFGIDRCGYGYSGARVFSIVPNTELDISYLQGVLNSTLIEFYLHGISALKAGGYYAYSSTVLGKIPVVLSQENEDAAQQMIVISQLVGQLPADAHDIESEIDARVALLYGLTIDEYSLVLKDTDSAPCFYSTALAWFRKLKGI